jgi:hypothetical protein
VLVGVSPLFFRQVYNNIQGKISRTKNIYCDKTIINITNASELSSITTVTMPSSSTNREIVIWDRTSGNSIAGGYGVTNGDLASIKSLTFDHPKQFPGGQNLLGDHDRV